MNGVYVPIPIHHTDDDYLWGRSAALNLDLCWENGSLRFRDPATGLYLYTFSQERAARLRAEAALSQAETTFRQAEAARADAEAARVRQLEAELRRLQNP